MSRDKESRKKSASRVIDFPSPETVDSEAAKWLALLDGDNPSPRQIRQFREWLDREDAHRREFETLVELWNDMNVLTRTTPPGNNAARPDPDADKSPAIPARIAALASIAFLVVLATLFVYRPHGDTVYTTEVGEQKTFALADTTSVSLNTDSRLSAAYDDKRRKITLERGEAFFQVFHDPERPFEVRVADGTTIRALGTAFAVHIREKDVELLVTEGTVAIERRPSERKPPRTDARQPARKSSPTGAESVKVPARTRAIFELGNGAEVKLAEMELQRIKEDLAWQHGVLTFDSEPLENVVEELSRYTPLKLVILDKDLGKTRVGGVFRLGDSDSLLEALRFGFGVRAKTVDENLVHLTAGEERP